MLALPLVGPLLPEGTHMIATSVISPFLVPLKITLLAGFLLALLVVLYQVWAFVAPGLYLHEKRLVLLLVSQHACSSSAWPSATSSSSARSSKFIQGFAPKSIQAAPDIEAYLGFVMNMFIAFGAAFEVPVIVVVLVRMGLMTVEKLREWRGYFIVIVVSSSWRLASSRRHDVVSQLALGDPCGMCLLYEAGIPARRWMGVLALQGQGAGAGPGSSARAVVPCSRCGVGRWATLSLSSSRSRPRFSWIAPDRAA